MEAKHFLSVIDGFLSDCKYAIDVEVALGQSKTKISSNVRLFANHLISNNKEVCIYSGDYFYASNLNNSVKDIPLWVAHYGVTKPDAINYIGFQYTNSGRIDGINGPVDLNEFKSSIFINSISPPVNIVIIIKAFQHAANLVKLTDKNGNKLVEDGIKGIHTKEVISKVFVTKGAHSELVSWIQQRLISLGFNCGKIGADSYFGLNTILAVKQFQISVRLKSDGIVGPLTIKELLK